VAKNTGETPGEKDTGYVDRIHAKPLPDILDEMDANIRAAAEAARRAERRLLPMLQKLLAKPLPELKRQHGQPRKRPR